MSNVAARIGTIDIFNISYINRKNISHGSIKKRILRSKT